MSIAAAAAGTFTDSQSPNNNKGYPYIKWIDTHREDDRETKWDRKREKEYGGKWLITYEPSTIYTS